MNLEKIQAAVSKYSFTAESQGEIVIVKNKKGQLAARVRNGQVEPCYSGKKNNCGSLVRNDIVAALQSEPAADAAARADDSSDDSLYDYKTGQFLRVATLEESAASEAAARADGGSGVISVDGRSCYVGR